MLQVFPDAIYKTLAALPEQQQVHRLIRSIHAAAWVDAAGNIRMVRESVGRHNALDKLIGAMARANTDPAEGFALLTSRCRIELVKKSMMVGIRMIVAVSAPTALAVRLAALGFERQRRLIANVRLLMSKGARFLVFGYLPHPPLPAPQLGLRRTGSALTLRNFLPGFVWTYELAT